MPWCPNCKAEYQEGYTECSDCGVALVESIEEEVAEFVPFLQATDQKLAEKLVNFLQYSKLPSTLSYQEENEVYVVSIPPRMEKEARKLYQAFYSVERENFEESIEESEDTELTSDEEEMTEGLQESEAEAEEESLEKGAYVFKADRYKDLAGTVWIFLFFGITGLIFVILNMAGILSILNGWIPNTVMGVLFLFFLYVALSTQQKAQKIRVEIAAENKLTEEINEWLKEHVTQEYIDSLHKDSVSEELNYIKLTEAIKDQLVEQFGKQNLSYLDRLVEEYYNDNF
jgi:hypothetical protein